MYEPALVGRTGSDDTRPVPQSRARRIKHAPEVSKCSHTLILGPKWSDPWHATCVCAPVRMLELVDCTESAGVEGGHSPASFPSRRHFLFRRELFGRPGRRRGIDDPLKPDLPFQRAGGTYFPARAFAPSGLWVTLTLGRSRIEPPGRPFGSLPVSLLSPHELSRNRFLTCFQGLGFDPTGD